MVNKLMEHFVTKNFKTEIKFMVEKVINGDKLHIQWKGYV